MLWLNVMASLIPSRRAIRWDVAGQEMSERLLKDVNDGLYAPLPPPYSKGASRAVVEQLTLANEWQVLHKFVKDPLRSVEGRQGASWGQISPRIPYRKLGVRSLLVPQEH
jgi:hypothetical protein